MVDKINSKDIVDRDKVLVLSGYDDKIQKIINVFLDHNSGIKDNESLDQIKMMLMNIVQNDSKKRKFGKASVNGKRFYKTRGRKYNPLNHNDTSKDEVYLSEQYPFIGNLMRHTLVNQMGIRENSKISLRNPWELVDGAAATIASNLPGYMPYQWASNLKIMDSNGENVCLVANDKRTLGNIILCAPEMFAMLSFLMFHKEALFSDSIKSEPAYIEFIERLNYIVTSLITTYKFSFANTDTDTILQALSIKSFPEALSFIIKKYDRAKEFGEIDEFNLEFSRFMSGEESSITNQILQILLEGFIGVFSSFGIGEAQDRELVWNFSNSITRRILSKTDMINDENIRDIISEVIRNNSLRCDMFETTSNSSKEKLEKSEDSFIPFLDVMVLKNIESFSELWNKGESKVFDQKLTGVSAISYQENKSDDQKNPEDIINRARNNQLLSSIKTVEDFNFLLGYLGCPTELVNSFPDDIKRLIVANVFEDLGQIDDSKANTSAVGLNILKILWKYYNTYMTVNPNYSFDKNFMEDIIANLFKIPKTKLNLEKAESGFK